MTKKLSAAKLKSHLAMAAFVVVAIATLTLTSAGIVEYTSVHTDLQADANQVGVQLAPFAATSLRSNLANVAGR